MENYYLGKFFHNIDKLLYSFKDFDNNILVKKILVIILLLLSTSFLSANERDTQLDKLFDELKKRSCYFSFEAQSAEYCRVLIPRNVIFTLQQVQSQ